MFISVIGRGLIGGSIEKAARRGGHKVAIHAGRGPAPDVSAADVVFVATPLGAIVRIVETLAAGNTLKDGAIVMDVAGVKRPVCSALSKYASGKWRFIGAHPMAGKEKTGYENASATLFDGASMILTPYSDTPKRDIDMLTNLSKSLGFARVVVTTPERHDEIIAYTSQLCHLVSSAYLRDTLSAFHHGFSAGSFRDMTRVGAPDPTVWSELLMANKDNLTAVLDRYTARLDSFRKALESCDERAMAAMLAEGANAKAAASKNDIAPGGIEVQT